MANPGGAQVRLTGEGRLVDRAEPFLQRVEQWLMDRGGEMTIHNARVQAFMVVHAPEALLHMSVLTPAETPAAAQPTVAVSGH